MPPKGTPVKTKPLVEMWPLSRCIPYACNPRVIPKAAVSKVAASIREFGFQQPIVVDEGGVIITGHTRLLAARHLGLEEVPVLVARGLTPTQVRAYRVADNRTGQEATWNKDLLTAEIAALLEVDFDVLLTGLDSAELERLSADWADPRADDALPAKAPARTKLGDLYALGKHRILCGDATDGADVARLLDGRGVDCVWTDPPYGIDYKGSPNHAPIAGDEKERDELVRTLLEPAFRHAAEHAALNAAFYIWHASTTWEDFAFALKAAGLEERGNIVWVNERATLSRSDYQWRHELCFYAARAGESPTWYGDRTQSTVWEVTSGRTDGIAAVIGEGLLLTDGNGQELYVRERPPKRKLRTIRLAAGESASLHADVADSDVWRVRHDEAKPDHPTQKPVALVTRALMNSTAAGDAVYDPFLGSGTALVGAERLGRVCYGMEIDPTYCDLAIARWEAASGAQAEPVS